MHVEANKFTYLLNFTGQLCMYSEVCVITGSAVATALC